MSRRSPRRARIKTPKRGVESIVLDLPPLWTAPHAAADQYRAITSPKRISAMGWGTKTGKTVGCSCWFIMRAFEAAGLRGAWVAPFYRTAAIGFGRVASMLKADPWMADHIHINNSKMEITLPNDTLLRFMTAKDPDAIFGEAYDFAVGDEAPRFSEAAWDALLSTMTQTMGPIRLAGNCDKGKKNWFYRLFVDGFNPDHETVASWSVKTTECPFIDPKSIEFAKERMSEQRFKALYLAEFPDDQQSVFLDIASIMRKCPGDHVLPIVTPPIFGRRYCAGMDIGRYKDWSIIHILDWETGETVYWERFNKTTWEEVRRRLKRASAMYNDCPMLIDSTHSSNGDQIYEDMLREGLPIYGYEFSTATKQPLIENLVMQVERKRVSFCSCMKQLEFELDGFEYEITESGYVRYNAATDGEDELAESHDDAVMGFALSVWLRGQVSPIVYETIEARRFAHGNNDLPAQLSGPYDVPSGRDRSAGF